MTISRQVFIVALLLCGCEEPEHPPPLGDGGEGESIPPAVLIGDDASGSGARSGASGEDAAGANGGSTGGATTSFGGSAGNAGSAGFSFGGGAGVSSLGGGAGVSSFGGHNEASAGTFSTGGI